MKRATLQDAYDLLHQGAVALAEVEAAGIRVDMDYLEKQLGDTSATIADLEAKIQSDKVWKIWRKRYGRKANLGSHEQLGTVLFEVMEIPYNFEKTRSQRYKTDKATLATVDLPFVQDYLRMGHISKLRSTYLLALYRETQGGYFYPVFNLHTASTFRSSSGTGRTEEIRSLNFQNLPIRNPEIAPLIRNCFIPPDDWQMGEIDYSNIEVRNAAFYNKDPTLIRYLEDPDSDMHRDTAMQLFSLKEYEVDKKTTRDCAKNMFVFPEFYGSYFIQCAPHIWKALLSGKWTLKDSNVLIVDHLRKHGIKELGECDPSRPPRPGTFEYVVKQVEKSFWEERFPVYTAWKKSWHERYLRNGGFTMLTGFRVYGVYRKNDVINYPIQGTAFHCLLWSLIRLVNWLRESGLKSRIIGQIHDSMVVYFHPKERDYVLEKAQKIMTKDLPREWPWARTVPLVIEAEVAPVNQSWYKKEKVAIAA